MVSATSISNRIVDAILCRQIAPNTRLGEQELANLFGCSRTIIREAMVELSAYGIVTVSPRKGWYVREITVEEARELYEARQVIETGLLDLFARRGAPLEAWAYKRLQEHIAQQRLSLDGPNVGRRSYLLGDFHVCMAECLGNGILASKLRELTVLTTLFTMQHQTVDDAHRSFQEHVAIVAALTAGRLEEARDKTRDHLGSWEEKVHVTPKHDPLAALRQALTPPAGLPNRDVPDMPLVIFPERD